MKILITTDLFRPAINGVVTSVLNLERELEKNGHEVKILAVSDTCSTYQMENVYYIRSVPAKSIRMCEFRYRGAGHMCRRLSSGIQMSFTVSVNFLVLALQNELQGKQEQYCCILIIRCMSSIQSMFRLEKT